MRRFITVILFLAACTGLPPAALPQNSKENADFKLAINLYNDGLYDLAAEQLRQFIAAYPGTTQGMEARFTLGLTQMQLKKYDDARLTFQTFALTYQDNPRAPEAWWKVGESYAAVNNVREAALGFERVKVFHPRSKLAPDALLKAAQYFLLAGERDGARKSLRVILQEYPTSTAALPARARLGKIYFDEGNLEQAQNEIRRVIDGDPSPEARAGALLLIGSIDQAAGRADQAQARYQEIIAKYKGSPAVQGAYVRIGELLASAGNHSGALENFRKALTEKNAPDSALIRDALRGTAEAHASLHDFAAAAADDERFLASAPADERTPDALWHLAFCAAAAGEYRKSNGACGKLLAPGIADGLRRRARIRLALNALEQKNTLLAAQQFDAYADAYPEDPWTPDVLLRAGHIAATSSRDERKTVAAYETIVSRYPSSAAADDALMEAARSRERTREFDRALESYRDLIVRYPASDFRADAEERIAGIETFEVKEKDAGLEKLALLVGDVLADRDKPGMALRLGEIYFSDLKNYSAAALQCTHALEAGLPPAKAADAMFMKARSLEFLSRKDPSRAPEAVQSFRSFLAAAPASPHAGDAALAAFRLSATSLGAARTAASLLALDSSFTRNDAVALTVGILAVRADSLPLAAQEFAAAARLATDTATAEEATYRLFDLLLKQNLADSAFAVGRKETAAFPNGPHTALVLEKMAAVAAGKDPARAADLYQRLLTDFPYTHAAASARRPLADALAAAGRTGEALNAYRELLEASQLNPFGDGRPDVSLLVALGAASQTAGKTADAKRYFTLAVARDRTGGLAGQAFAALGAIARSAGEKDAATSYFRQSEAAAPGTTATRDIADLLFDNGDYADAASQYARLSASAQTDSLRRQFDARLIISLLRHDEVAKADADAALFLKRYPDTGNDQASFELERGNHFFRKEVYAQAMKAFQHVADKFDDSPSAPAALYWVGKTLEATEKPKEAIAILQTLLTKHPHDPIIPRAHLALGNLSYASEQWTDAINHYRAIVDDPAADPALLPPAMSNLIETYEIGKAYDGALTLTRRYLELFPNSDDAFDKKIKIGILYDKLGYYDQAVLHLQSILDEAGSDLEGEIRYYIAEANYNKGDFQQAILDFLKVPYLVTKKGKIDWTANSLYMAGQAYEKMGRYDQALTMYQQILDRAGIDPTFKAAARKEIDRVRGVLKQTGR
jgi:TolA-binding protein